MNTARPPTPDDAPERDLGAQPIAALLARLGLAPHDLVAASKAQLTHKMVQRACKGRRLTPNVQRKVLDALNACTTESHGFAELFTYGAGRAPTAAADRRPAG